MRHRRPAWTDRILWRPNDDVRLIAYTSTSLTASDHRPVCALFSFLVSTYGSLPSSSLAHDLHPPSAQCYGPKGMVLDRPCLAEYFCQLVAGKAHQGTDGTLDWVIGDPVTNMWERFWGLASRQGPSATICFYVLIPVSSSGDTASAKWG